MAEAVRSTLPSPEELPGEAQVPASIAGVLDRLKDELARGELIGAYDTAEKARKLGLDDPLIRYRRVLALARAGATESAAKEYAELDLASEGDTDSRALWARILKDRAMAAAPSGRPARLREAAEAYGAIHDATGQYFPGINAAMLLALSGDPARARALAARLLDDRELHAGTGYWEAATRAEAHLILGDGRAASEELHKARLLSDGNWGDLSSTRRQLRRLLDAAPVEGLSVAQLLEMLRPPRVAYLAPPVDADPAALTTQLAALFAEHDIGFATAALWTSASLVAAETALASGIELHLVLPYERDAYLAHAEKELSPSEARRRRACLDAARSAIAVTADSDHADETLIEYAAVVARGLARTRARLLSTDSVDLPARLPRAAMPVLHEDAPGPSPEGRPVRELRALLFADAKGFSKLPESDLPVFWSRFMTEMAKQLDSVGESILYRNSWGDAVFCVTEKIETAAHVALAMQERANELRQEYPRSPVLRIGLHHGPVFRGWDPVRRTPSYFGTQVSRAARVEPIVPPGDVYVTEPFAAVLTAMGAKGFEAEYVGVLPLHKNYGEHRMYRLARRWHGD